MTRKGAWKGVPEGYSELPDKEETREINICREGSAKTRTARDLRLPSSPVSRK